MSQTIQELQKIVYEVMEDIYGGAPTQRIVEEIYTIIVSLNLNSKDIKERCADLLTLVLYLYEKLGIKYSFKIPDPKREPFGVIYKLNSPSNKVYIGQSRRFLKRMHEYKYSRNTKKQPKLKNAISKYGFDNFAISILSICDNIMDLNDKEIFWIKKYKSDIEGYNIRSGGSVSPMSEETKEKLSKNNWLRARGATQEYRDKMSIACAGHKNGFYGKHHSDLTKNNLSKLFKGKEMSKSTKEKMRLSHIGLKQTEDTKRKKSLVLSKNVYKVTLKGNTEIINNLTSYALKIGVSPAALFTVFSNKRKSHKNIYVQKLFDGTTGDKLRVGIFGGAMNPITLGHVEVIEMLLKKDIFDQIWVTPCNKHVFGKGMVSSLHRIKMCELAILNKEKVHIFTKEIIENYTGSTYKFMRDVIKSFPTCDFSFIIGLDNANTFDQWVNYEELERLARFVVIPRTSEKPKKGVSWYLRDPHLYIEPDEPLMEISSTMVRKDLELLYLASTSTTINQEYLNDPSRAYNTGLNKDVKEYILKNRLYLPYVQK